MQHYPKIYAKIRKSGGDEDLLSHKIKTTKTPKTLEQQLKEELRSIGKQFPALDKDAQKRLGNAFKMVYAELEGHIAGDIKDFTYDESYLVEQEDF